MLLYVFVHWPCLLIRVPQEIADKRANLDVLLEKSKDLRLEVSLSPSFPSSFPPSLFTPSLSVCLSVSPLHLSQDINNPFFLLCCFIKGEPGPPGDMGHEASVTPNITFDIVK